MPIPTKFNRLGGGGGAGMPWIEFDNEGRVIDMDIRKSRRLYLEGYTLPTVFDYECPELVDANFYGCKGFLEVTSDFPKLKYLTLAHQLSYDPRPQRLLGHFPSLTYFSAYRSYITEIRYGFPAYGGDRPIELRDSTLAPSAVTALMESLPTVQPAACNAIMLAGAHTVYPPAPVPIEQKIDPTIATKKGWLVNLTSGDVKP